MFSCLCTMLKALFQSLFSRTCPKRPETLRDYINDGDFTGLSDAEAIHLVAKSFKPELSHLRHASATVESAATTPSGCLDRGETPSRLIYGTDFAEINRTLISVLALKWILADDYASFTRGQQISVRLSEESFRQMQKYFSQRLQSRDDIYALVVAIMIDDIGKDKNLADELAKNNVLDHHVNHSEVVFQAALAGEIPAFNGVPDSGRKAILQCLQIGDKLNIGQLVQGECVPASLSVLHRVQGDACACDMRAMVTLLDVAGAGAHRDARGCAMLTESVYQAYMAAIEIVEEFISGAESIPDERASYDRILASRAETLYAKGFDRLSTEIDEERALLRLLCMGRVDNRESAEIFRKALSAVSPSTRQDLVSGLSVNGLSDGIAIIPYYAPGLLAEVIRSFAENELSSVVEGVSAFLRFLARVFDGSTPRLGVSGGVVERDLSFIQNTIKSTEFADNPAILDEVHLPWKEFYQGSPS